MHTILYIIDLETRKLVASSSSPSRAQRRAETLCRRTGRTHAVAELVVAYQATTSWRDPA